MKWDPPSKHCPSTFCIYLLTRWTMGAKDTDTDHCMHHCDHKLCIRKLRQEQPSSPSIDLSSRPTANSFGGAGLKARGLTKRRGAARSPQNDGNKPRRRRHRGRLSMLII